MARLWSDLKKMAHFEVRRFQEGGAYFNLNLKRCGTY